MRRIENPASVLWLSQGILQQFVFPAVHGWLLSFKIEAPGITRTIAGSKYPETPEAAMGAG
jgi:hypothetical protein